MQDEHPYLTPRELIALTGKTRRKPQMRALGVMRIHFVQRADGSLAVLRSHHDEVMTGAQPAKKPKAERRVEPNWEAIA